MKYKKVFLFMLLAFLTIIGLHGVSSSVFAEENSEVVDAGLFDFEAYIKDSDIIDGTGPFDAIDTPGNDSGPKNGIVRSFDTITYPIKITINPKTTVSLKNIRLRLSGTLDNGITDGRVNGKFSVGGSENMVTETVSFEQTYMIAQTGNAIMIPVAVDVQGAKDGLKLTPDIKVEVISVDGTDYTKNKVFAHFDNLPSTTVSSKVSLTHTVRNGLAGQGIPYYPYQGITGNTEDFQNTQAFSVAIGLRNLPGKSTVKGATFPTGKINYRVKLSGHVNWFENNGNPVKGSRKTSYSEPLNFDGDDEPIYLLDHNDITNTSSLVGSPNTLMEGKSYSYPYTNRHSAAQSFMSNLNPSTVRSQNFNRVWDSGDWEVQKPTVSSSAVTYKGSNEDYIVGSTFPRYRSDGYTGGRQYNDNERIFSTQGFMYLMPNQYRIGRDLNPEGKANQVVYRIDVTIESYEDEDGNVHVINQNKATSSSELNLPNGSYSVQNTLLAPSGKQLGTPNIGWSTVSKGDVSTILGEDVRHSSGLGSSVVSYGGYDAVYTWNADSFELTKNNATAAANALYSRGYYNIGLKHIRNDKDTQQVLYGVPSYDDYSFESFINRGKYDYDWYDTYDEAIENGEVGALMSRVTAPVGPKWQGGAHTRLKVKTKRIGSRNDKGDPNLVMTHYYPRPDQDGDREIYVSGPGFIAPAEWDEDGNMISRQQPYGSTVNFETLAVVNAETSSVITADKATYYNSEEVKWTVKSSIVMPENGAPDGFDGSVQVTQTLPKGLDYKARSGRVDGVEVDPSIEYLSNGQKKLTWELLISPTNRSIPTITFNTTINPFALASGVQSSLEVKNVISSPIDTRGENLRTSKLSLNILKVGMVGIYESIDVDNGEKNSSFNIRMRPYTTIEDEYDVKGLTNMPEIGDRFGSDFQGTTQLKAIGVSGNRPVSIYLHNDYIVSDKPHEIDTSTSGWYEYTGNEDISRAKSLLFHVEGVMKNTDDIEISFQVQTKDNNFGNVYYNETVINSGTNYRLSPISNRVRYTIRADAELNLERIQIYTANSKENLPVNLRVNKVYTRESTKERAKTEPVQLVIYEKDTGNEVYRKDYTIGSLERENALIVPSQYLQKNTNKSYEARIEGYNTDRIYVIEGADKIDTLGYTASETKMSHDIVENSTLEYTGVVMTERVLGFDITKLFEKISVPVSPMDRMKTGYGFAIAQKVNYSNDLGLSDHVPPVLASYMDEELVDGSYGEKVANKTKLNLVSEPNETDNVLTNTYRFPHVYVEELTGEILSDEQYSAKAEELENTVVSGGHNVYIPIWMDELGVYDYEIKTITPIGINEVSLSLRDTVDVYAYMFGHIGSETIKLDEILISPADLTDISEGWTDEELEWLRGE